MTSTVGTLYRLVAVPPWVGSQLGMHHMLPPQLNIRDTESLEAACSSPTSLSLRTVSVSSPHDGGSPVDEKRLPCL